MSTVINWYLDARGDKIDSARAGYAADHLRRFFGSTPAINAGINLQQQYVDARRKRVKDETIRRELTVLSAALNLAAKHEKIPAAPPKLTLQASEAKDRWLSRVEVAKLYRHLRVGGDLKGRKGARKTTAHLLLFTRLAIGTGARPTALLDLTWDRVDLERGMMDLKPKGRRGTNKRRPMVPLAPHLVRALKAAERRKDSDYVISWQGEKVGRIIRGFKNHAAKLKITEVSPKTLRHTFATWAARSGVPLYDIGGVLGHSNPSTTQRYAKHQPERLREVMRKARRK